MRSRPSFSSSAPRLLAAVALLLGGCAQSCHDDTSANTAASDAADAGATLVLYPPDAGPDDPTVAAHFQGTIDMRLDDAREQPLDRPDQSVPPSVYSFSARGDSYRWDLFEKGTPRGDYRIYDQSARRIYTVLPAETVILSTPISGDPADGGVASYVLEDLHQKGAVAGHACDRMRTTQGSKRYELCTTPDLVPFPFHMLPGLMQEVIPFGDELFARKLFPLLVTEYEDADAGAPVTLGDAGAMMRGHLLARFHVTGMEQTRIDPAKFVLPKYNLQMRQTLQATTKVVH